MDGVVLVALPAGTLHYARSLSARFDRRHPRADRMNLAALVFALHNFAENTLTSDATATSGAKPPTDSEDEGEGTTAAAIALFATPNEQLAAALSPSKKLLVALFTPPSVDADAAKWIATRVARNFESTDNVDSRITATLNHVPGLFRSALTRAVESHVDRQLAALAAFIRHLLVDNDHASSLDEMIIGFYYRYDVSELAGSSENKREAGAGEGIVLQPGNDDFSSLGMPLTVPPAGEIRSALPSGKLPRLPPRIEANSSVFLSTWSLLAVSRATPGHGNPNTSKKTKQKKSKKKGKNAVVDHAEPRVFQRVIGLSDSLTPASVPPLATQCSSNTIASERIATLVGSLLDAVAPSAATDKTDKVNASTSLRLLTWRNPPLDAGDGSSTRTNSPPRPSSSSSGHQNELVAWQQDHGILYCLLPLSGAHRIANNAGIRLQVDKMLATMEQTVRGMLSA